MVPSLVFPCVLCVVFLQKERRVLIAQQACIFILAGLVCTGMWYTLMHYVTLIIVGDDFNQFVVTSKCVVQHSVYVH